MPLFSTPVPPPRLCFAHPNSCWGKPCENSNKRSQSAPPHPSSASRAPACAQSTTQHSQVNDCQSHQHPNSPALGPRDWPTSETYSRPASHFKQTFEQLDIIEMCKMLFTDSKCKGMLSVNTRILLFCNIFHHKTRRFLQFRRVGWWYNETPPPEAQKLSSKTPTKIRPRFKKNFRSWKVTYHPLKLTC